jgi:hypothetical protein
MSAAASSSSAILQPKSVKSSISSLNKSSSCVFSPSLNVATAASISRRRGRATRCVSARNSAVVERKSFLGSKVRGSPSERLHFGCRKDRAESRNYELWSALHCLVCRRSRLGFMTRRLIRIRAGLGLLLSCQGKTVAKRYDIIAEFLLTRPFFFHFKKKLCFFF